MYVTVAYEALSQHMTAQHVAHHIITTFQSIMAPVVENWLHTDDFHLLKAVHNIKPKQERTQLLNLLATAITSLVCMHAPNHESVIFLCDPEMEKYGLCEVMRSALLFIATQKLTTRKMCALSRDVH